MITIGSARMFLAAWVAAALVGYAADAMGSDGAAGVVAGNSAFALDLYARLKSGEGNLFFSPCSISSCLAMIYAGARGDTARQMAQTLHFSAGQAGIASAFGELQRQLNTGGRENSAELEVANGLWGQTGHPFLPGFLAVARDGYQAGLNQVDFRAQSESAREEINHWVSEKTKGKITSLLERGNLDGATRLVLVNAIYFKGRWAREFNQAATAEAPFRVTPSRTLQAPLMNLTADFKYAEAEGLQLLELRYVGGDLSMVVLLPAAADGLKNLEGSLNGPALDGWLAQAREQKVHVFLPRFKLTARFSLGGTLAEMGMRDAFTPAADFSGLDGARDLFLSAVVHKTFVDVNEQGTEAAAVTGGVARALVVRRPQPIPTFRADHPFLFLIRDTRSGSILFLGRLIDPAAAGSKP